MATNIDPYRTLGLAPGASLDEVKRAYRRLAKANHPDAAGELALPRFLAIQAAYDQIAGPGASAGAGGPGGPGPASGSSARRPWDADPGRAGATHRAYGGRTRRTRPAPGQRPGTPPPRGEPPEPPGGGGARSRRPDRPPNKATLGSTSYDGADAEPFEPDWGGASWYGTTSGTYWTLNPKEYADPRKHGPEYQARGRRRQPDAPPGPDEPVARSSPTSDAADEATHEPGGATDPDAGRPRRPTPPPTHTTASWWEATAGDVPGDTRRAGASATPSEPPPGPKPADATADAATAVNPSLTADAALDALRSWLDEGRPGLIGRLGRAAFGWAPVALGIGWVGGEISGCGRFSAECDPAAAPISWFAQLLALLALLAIPRLARVAAMATIGTIAAAVSGALLLSATGSQDATAAGRTALGGLIVIAWGVGFLVATWREVRVRLRAGPVS
jgi:curved DNA-binding protein CbpA